MLQISRKINKTHKSSVASVVHLITNYRLLVTPQVLALALCLTGCMGVYEGGFECPPGEGVGCKSISEVNKMVNQGELPKASPQSPAHSQDILSQSDPATSSCNTCKSLPLSGQEKPEIWINPLYLNFHKKQRQDKEFNGQDSI